MKLIYRNVSSRGRCNIAVYHEQALADFKAQWRVSPLLAAVTRAAVRTI
jgi:hypothetical protein